MAGLSKQTVVGLEDFPVHCACREGDVQSLAKYVSIRGDRSQLLAEDNLYHWTPVHWASFFGQLPSLIVLREAGVGVDTTTARFKQTAAHIAAFAGSDHCLKYLIHFGCNVNAQDYLGETPLHKAARTNSMGCARALVDGHALPSVRNNLGQTPAVLAAACGHAEMGRSLLQYELFVSQQRGVPGPQVSITPPGPGPSVGHHAGLNGGLVPERPAAAAGPWCYQPPPPRPPPSGCPPGGGGGGPRAGGGDQRGGGDREFGCAPVVGSAFADGGALRIRKRCRDEVVFEELKRRRLAGPEPPLPLLSVGRAETTGPEPGLGWPGDRQARAAERHLA